MDYFIIYFDFILEAIKSGISDWRELKAPCNYIRTGLLDRSLGCPRAHSAKHRTGAQHPFCWMNDSREKRLGEKESCSTQVHTLNTLGWLLTGVGWKIGINQSIRAGLCMDHWHNMPWPEVQPREKEKKTMGKRGKVGIDKNEYILGISNWLLYLQRPDKTKLRSNSCG